MKHIVILLTLVALLGKDLLRVLSLFTVRCQEAKGKYLGMLSFLAVSVFYLCPQKESPNYTNYSLHIISQSIHI